MGERWLNVLTAIAFGAVAVALIVSLAGENTSAGSVAQSEPVPRISAEQWAVLTSTGHRVGSRPARVTLVEFGDFQCPACQSLALLVDSLLREYPADFALVYHHFPLSYHRLAYPLAQASECASRQGRFHEFYRSAYAEQNRLGVVGIVDLAVQAGLDTSAFERCRGDVSLNAPIDGDSALARKIGFRATPGVAIDGTTFGPTHTMSGAELRERVRRSREGR